MNIRQRHVGDRLVAGVLDGVGVGDQLVERDVGRVVRRFGDRERGTEIERDRRTVIFVDRAGTARAGACDGSSVVDVAVATAIAVEIGGCHRIRFRCRW